ncbi:ABC transporter substrate-binding protein [Pelagibacterium lacus]|uniref:ABC transporter substrate-binding protein n=1 Tax=Pelagibacterium lacus TaxID=2282655 RepID=A0A369W5H7_9HYPH|nr:ABC transporter substrate-binding protein [Pelagibacterium lacus]RDE09267.1 ABC transporter substrate-binding protein [Pelagibacterium lacus]
MMKLMKSALAGTTVLAGLSFSLAASAADLTIALSNPVNTFDPHMTASVGSDLSVLSHIYPSLILRGPDLALQGNLATEWTLVDDTTWHFTLREGATFANGEALDAEAVKWNLDRVRDPELQARVASWFSLVSEVNVISPTELEVKTSSPYPAFADQLSMFLLLPPQWTEENNPVTATMAGGPYQVRNIVPGESVILEPNPEYFGDPAEFDTVTFQVIPETGGRIAALLAGDVDLVTGIPVTEVDRINQSGNATAGAVDSTRNVMIKFNTTVPPLDNVTVRQALNYAIDKEGIAQALFNGLAQPAQCQVLSSNYFGFNPDLEPYPYDPERAIQLLAESGADLSQPIVFDVPAGVYLQGTEVAQVVASQLTDIGLNIQITELEFSVYMNKYLQSRELAPLSLLAQAWPTIDADGLLTLFAPGNNYAYWDDADFGAALDEGRSSTDPAVREAAYKTATEVMCEQAPAIFLYTQPATYAYSNDVTWTPRGDDWVRAFDMHPAE